MKITVMHGRKRHDVNIPGAATVGELKEKLQPLTGIGAEAMDLQIMGDSLCDEASLAEQGVQDKDKIQLVAAGGGPPLSVSEPPPTQSAGPARPARAGGDSAASASAPPAARRTGSRASPSPPSRRSGSGRSAQPAPAVSSDAGGDGALDAIMRQLDGVGEQLDELDSKVRARETPHQELFTRVLEKLDCLELDRRALAAARVARPPARPPSSGSRRSLSKPCGRAALSLSDDQRGEVRPVRKALVRRCEAISAQALKTESGR